MAGRSRAPGEALREHRTTVRWTKEEYARLEKAREALGVSYTVDLIRTLVLNRLEQVETTIERNVAQ